MVKETMARKAAAKPNVREMAMLKEYFASRSSEDVKSYITRALAPTKLQDCRILAKLIWYNTRHEETNGTRKAENTAKASRNHYE